MPYDVHADAHHLGKRQVRLGNARPAGTGCTGTSRSSSRISFFHSIGGSAAEKKTPAYISAFPLLLCRTRFRRPTTRVTKFRSISEASIQLRTPKVIR